LSGQTTAAPRAPRQIHRQPNPREPWLGPRRRRARAVRRGLAGRCVGCWMSSKLPEPARPVSTAEGRDAPGTVAHNPRVARGRSPCGGPRARGMRPCQGGALV